MEVRVDSFHGAAPTVDAQPDEPHSPGIRSTPRTTVRYTQSHSGPVNHTAHMTEQAPNSPEPGTRTYPGLPEQLASESQPEPTPLEIPAEETPSMLDVHPAHHAASSWRDFFVHIATIALGLLLAIGLEQMVAAIHHRHQVRDARAQIQDEITHNIKDLAVDISRYQEAKVRMRKNIVILEEHRAGKKVSDQLDYALRPGYNINDGALHTAEVNGALGMMPEGEIADYRYIETTTAAEVDAAHGYFEALFQANAFLGDRSLDELQPEETTQLIQLTSAVVGKLDYAMQLQSFLDWSLHQNKREK